MLASVRMLVFVVPVCLFLMSGGLNDSEASAIDSREKTPFSRLGWTDDVILTANSPPAIVRFELPEGAKQGDPIWYGLALKFEWIGNPGDEGDFAFLYGDWNGQSIHQFKVKRPVGLNDGFQWSNLDLVNGSSHGYELSSLFRGSITNIAQFRAVRGGWNFE